MAHSFTLNTEDELVKSLLAGLTDQQRQLLSLCAESVETKPNGMQIISDKSSAKPMPYPTKPTSQFKETAPIVRKPSVSRGKDLNLMKKLMGAEAAVPSKYPNKSREQEKSLNHTKMNNSSADRFGSNNSLFHKYDATKSKRYEIVEQQMRDSLKANANVPKTSETKITKVDSKVDPKVTKMAAKPEIVECILNESNEEFEKFILSCKTGLESNLIPKRIIGINEYKGMIFHLVEWTDRTIPAEIIASKILSAHYPQVVIEYYESLAVSVNIREFREKEWKVAKQTQYKNAVK